VVPFSARGGRSVRSPLLPLFPLLTTLVAAGLEAQTSRMPFQRLSIEDGLSQGTVNCILQDATGFLWLGTQDGLNRYDGYSFRVHKHDPTDPESLPASWVEALAEDPDGDLWVGTRGGLARWRRSTGSFERFAPATGEDAAAAPPSLPDHSVRALRFDRDGDLWIGTFQSGLLRLDPDTGVVEHFRHHPEDPASLADDRVRALYQDRGGGLWIGTLGGLSRFDPERRSFTSFRHHPDDPASLADDRVFAILEDSQGTLWVGTEAGLHQSRDPDSGFLRHRHDPDDPASLADDWVTDLLEDRAGRLWIATDGGLHRRQPQDGAFERFRHDATDPLSLSNDRLLALLEDRAGLIWIGTQGGGLNRWNPATEAFEHYRADATGAGGLASNAVFAFSEDPRGRLWIGTLGGGIDVLDRAAGSFENHRYDPADPGSLGDDKVSALLHDRSGNLWVGTFGSGLSRLDRGAGAFRHYRSDPRRPGTLSDDVVTSLHQDRHGTLWVGTQRGGLNRLDPAPQEDARDGGFQHYRHDPADPGSLSENQVTAFAEDPDGALWVGTFGGGLDRLDPDRRRFAHFRHDPARPSSLSSDTVFALHRDAGGTLWVGTQLGLNRLSSPEEGSFGHYFERDGLPNDVVWGIESDSRGRLWISTNDGLARFDPETESFEIYTTVHGLQANEFNFGAHFRSASGELFFGGVNGFNAFRPERLASNDTVPPVVLTSFAIRNQPVRFDRPFFDVEEVTLGHRDYFFDVEIAALDFTAPEENRYRYRLGGFDEGWIDLGHRRRLTFTNLDPGRYRLRVQGSNNDGVWNREGASLAIRVTPPPWATWWAYTLYSLAVAAAAWGFVRSQHQKVEREREQVLERERLLEQRARLITELENKNAELQRFNYTLSHDLRTPLVTIKGFLGLLERDVASGRTDRVAGDIERISTAADRMTNLLNELLEYARVSYVVKQPEKVPLGELVEEAIELLELPLAERGVELEIAPHLPTVSGDRLRLRQLFQNLIENAVKYMGDQSRPRIEVGVRHDGPEQVVYVRDNGIGIDPKYHRKVFGLFERLDATDRGTGIGLALVQRIIELHGGKVWVESEGLGTGSTFCLRLDHLQAAEVGEARWSGAAAPEPRPLPVLNR